MLLIPPTDPSKGRTSGQGYNDFNLGQAILATIIQLILSMLFYTGAFFIADRQPLGYILLAGGAQFMYSIAIPAAVDSVSFTSRWIRATILTILGGAPLVTFILLLTYSTPIAAYTITPLLGIATAFLLPIPLFLIIAG